MRILLLDNHDSFTAILHHYLWELAGEKPLLYRNDALTREELESLDFDAAVLSPGPGHPANVRDFGVCRDLLELFPHKPVLGVCLGMQGMAHFAGARVIPWNDARHGRPDRITHDGAGIFRDIPSEFTAIRYHSLVVEPQSLPESVHVTARSVEDQQVMGVSFAGRPWFGVQFHPEALGTEHGKQLLKNFLDIAKPGRIPVGAHSEASTPRADARTGLDSGENRHRENTGSASSPLPSPIPHRELSWRDPAEVFVRHFHGVVNTFWLDSSARQERSGWQTTVMGRSESAHVFYDWNSFRAWAESLDLGRERAAPWAGYRGGPVGHLAYELHRDTLRQAQRGALGVPTKHGSSEPLARWMLPQGWLVFDPAARKAFAAWEGSTPPAWLHAVIDGWENDDWKNDGGKNTDAAPSPEAAGDVVSKATLPPFAAWKPLLSEEVYTGRVRALQDAIARGDTYEACLTHAFSTETPDPAADPVGIFLRLRARNPAPYAAYLAFADVRILSASPELFLEASAEGVLRGRPIKGTRRRGEDAGSDRALRAELAASEKDAAENRMIVDLTRHDFARVCEPGSVEVPVFLEIEAHPAVFQLVSEVRGALDRARGFSGLDAIAACFPGGSMTGAPKERTVEILSALEAAPRGIYSGALGYLTRGGAFTLAMVIRTLENRGAAWRAGCGGAVLIDSDPANEWREATLKARSVIDAAS